MHCASGAACPPERRTFLTRDMILEMDLLTLSGHLWIFYARELA